MFSEVSNINGSYQLTGSNHNRPVYTLTSGQAAAGEEKPVPRCQDFVASSCVRERCLKAPASVSIGGTRTSEETGVT